MWSRLGIFFSFTLTLTGLAEGPVPTAAQLEFFEKEVRPVLVENCYKCHGEKKQKASLRLDARDFVLKGDEVGEVVVPGHPEASRLIKAINHVKAKDVEPMPGEDDKLSPRAIAAITEWVKQGLPWPAEAAPVAHDPLQHWAFQPVKAPALPEVKAKERVKTSLDYFVLAQLEHEGLSLSPEVPKEVLAKRLYLTLWGVSPTDEEIQAFVHDTSPQATEKLVDQLLANPAFGERWGRHWLDVARYADTKGYVFEEERRYAYAYTYRDWVVAAFNRDLPYDQFLRLQIAADRLVTGEDNHDLAALGFLTLGRRFLNNQQDIIDDRMDVVMRGTQALTMGCARCHDHKFDPIPTTDYYSLYAVFNSSEEPKEKPLLKPFTPTKDSQEFDQELARLEAKASEMVKARYEGSFSLEKTTAYLTILNRSFLEKGLNVDLETKRQALYPPVYHGWEKALSTHLKPNDAVGAFWWQLREVPEVQFAVKAKELLANPVGLDPVLLENLKAKPLLKFSDVLAAYAQTLVNARGKSEVAPQKIWASFWSAEGGPLSPKPESLIASYSVSDVQGYRKLVREAEAYKATSPKSPPRAMVMQDKPNPVNGTVFLRGNAGRPGKSVPRQYLAILSSTPRQPFQHGSGRLDLANAIADKNNPLTARVMVNRAWSQVFGQPLVETPSDFGVRTPAPRNPALLDHLASDFMNQGWSMKKLIRTMVLSATFRQSAAITNVNKDPDNSLLSHMNRRRLDFEAMRDSMLRLSDRLEFKTGGQPFDLIGDFTNSRRTVYGFIDRQNLPSVFRTFDFANPDYHVPKRNQTTTPQQALWMINHPFVRSLSDSLAQRFAKLPTAEQQVTSLYRKLLGRNPTAQELKLAVDFLREEALLPVPSTWQNGVGGWNAVTKQVSFTPMKVNLKGRLTPTDQFPDPFYGHAMLTSAGGHPGNHETEAVIRRWNASAAVTVKIEGDLHVPSKVSQGVRARIVSSVHGLLGEWTVLGGETKSVTLASVALAPQEVIDFILDDWKGPNSDGFRWSPVIKDAKTSEVVSSAAGEFGQVSQVQTPLSALAQVLLECNEFNFAD